MQWLRNSALVRSVPVTLTLLTTTSACTTWAVKAPFETTVVDRMPDKVQVTDHWGTVTKLRSPVIRNDSIIGVLNRQEPYRTGERIGPQTVAMPLTDVARISETNSTATTVVGAVAFGLLLFYMASEARRIDPDLNPYD